MSVIEVKNVFKSFGKNVLYEDISLSVEQGETVGIVGENAVGKSVLFRIIAGLEKTDKGSVVVNGRAVGVDFSFPENVGLFVNQPGYVEFYDGFTNLSMLAEIKGKIDDKTIKEYMKKVGLDPEDKTRVKNYSSGMKQKLGITQAIMEGQDVILLDEPFNALDFRTNHDVLVILAGLKKEKKSILLTSHQHQYLEKICDKMYIILDKKLVPFDENLKQRYFSAFTQAPEL